MADPSNEYAVVLYNGPDVLTGETNINSSTNEQSIKQQHCGLSNQGATCYMNSVLQSLFMTPEFRKAIFQWKYDEKEHGKVEDCIPFQLQKLFAKLQMQSSRFCSTQELTKSFQWDHGNAFEQQDIQEFYTVFCDAIEQTTKGSEVDGFLSDIFEGTILNYIECKDYQYESNRPENFNHVTLTVRNPFEKIYNDSLEKALQVYLKPEMLSGDNQYYLESEQKKVDAIKGVKFFKLPKIQIFILNRFSFDYMTMKREKLDDYVSFPFILNMNDYINGYEGIKNKIQEKNPEYFSGEAKTFKQAKAETSTRVATSRIGSTIGVGSKTVKASSTIRKKAKPSSETRSFLQQMKKRAKPKEQDADVLLVPDGDGNAIRQEIDPADAFTADQTTANTKTQQTEASTTDIQIANPDVGSKMQIEDEKPNKEDPNIQTDEVTIENDKPAGTDDSSTQYRIANKGEKVATKGSKASQAPQKKELSQEEQDEIRRQKEERAKKRMDERNSLIQDSLKEGPLVYELYALLMHSGGAYGGHYYTFIKSFEDDKWYKFDDTNVTEIDPDELPSRAFGGSQSSNGYMLLYRQLSSADEKLETVSNEDIPAYLKQIIEKEAKREEIIEQRKIAKSNIMNLRIFHQLEVKLIPTNLKDTLEDLLDKTIAEYKIPNVDRKNIRLRAYQPNTDSMMETYTGRESKTLEELKIFSHKILAVEIKTDNQVFEEFDADRIAFKIAPWRPEIATLEESDLQVKKVWVSRDASFGELVLATATELGIPTERLRIYRKLVSHGIPTADNLTIEENLDKPFEELKLFEAMLLFAEQVENSTDSPKWAQEFEKDAFRCKIRFNNPYKDVTSDFGIEYNQTLWIDSRQSLSDMKAALCKSLDLNSDEVIIKKGGKMGTEIKDLRATVESQNLINGSSIFLEFGRPSKPGEIRVFFMLATKYDPERDNFSHQYEDLCELTIDGALKPSEIKPMLVEELKKRKNIEINPEKVRLREKVSERITKVYREVSLKSQQVSDKKQIAVELLDYEDKLSPKEVVAVIRLWDSEKHELGPRTDVIIEKNKTLLALGEKIHKHYPHINSEDMLATRIIAPWNFNRYTLVDEEWHPLNDTQNLLQTFPYFISADGMLLIVRDINQRVRELSEEEQKELGVLKAKTKTRSSGYGAKGADGRYIPKEAGIKIKIKTKAQQEEESKNQSDTATSTTQKPKVQEDNRVPMMNGHEQQPQNSEDS